MNITYEHVTELREELVSMMVALEKSQDAAQKKVIPDIEFIEKPEERVYSYLSKVAAGTFFIKLDKEIVGYYSVADNMLYKNTVVLSELFVKPLFRNKGVGKTVIKHIKDTFKKDGYKFIVLGCAPGNGAAKHLYESRGINIYTYNSLMGRL